MAQSSPYVEELNRACAAVASGVGRAEWKLVYQSRSGPPGQPWLEPDICDYLREIRADAVIAPIGFLSDHMEVLYDLDTEARAVCEEIRREDGARRNGRNASGDDPHDRGTDRDGTVAFVRRLVVRPRRVRYGALKRFSASLSDHRSPFARTHITRMP